MRNESFLDALAKRTAVEIIRRHAPDCVSRQGLVDAIARIKRQGLEGQVRLCEELWQMKRNGG